MSTTIELLKQSLVPEVTEKELNEIMSFSTEQTFQAGEIVYRENEKSSQLLLVKEGQVDVQYMMATGRRETLDICREGDILVWSALLPPHNTTSIGICRAKTVLITIDALKLRDFCKKNTNFGFYLMRHIAGVIRRRLQAARIEIVSLRD
jgi:CRP-like cAMP-binding protein